MLIKVNPCLTEGPNSIENILIKYSSPNTRSRMLNANKGTSHHVAYVFFFFILCSLFMNEKRFLLTRSFLCVCVCVYFFYIIFNVTLLCFAILL